jgi:hypothetical protein
MTIIHQKNITKYIKLINYKLNPLLWCRERLKKTTKLIKLSIICENMFKGNVGLFLQRR